LSSHRTEQIAERLGGLPDYREKSVIRVTASIESMIYEIQADYGTFIESRAAFAPADHGRNAGISVLSLRSAVEIARPCLLHGA
jgi:hypothetical protein